MARMITDHLGRKFIQEYDEVRDTGVVWNTDDPCVDQMLSLYVDWLYDNNCCEEAELLQLQWGMKVGRVVRTEETLRRVNELRKTLGARPNRVVRKTEPAVQGYRERRAELRHYSAPVAEWQDDPRLRNRMQPERYPTLLLDDPCGMYYLRATVNILHMPLFLDELHQQPIIELVLQCNGTRHSQELVQKYMNYKWLKKVQILEFNNLDVSWVAMRGLFGNTEIQPIELRVTGRGLGTPSVAQMELLPLVAPNLKYLNRLTYGTQKHEYRH